MKIFWIGFAMVLPMLAQTPDSAISARDRLQAAVQDMRVLEAERVVKLEGGVVKNAPYSADAVTQTTQVLGDGNRIENSTAQKLYRDSEGRERREESVLATGALAQAEMPHVITINDPVEKVAYTLNAQQHTARLTQGMRILPAGGGGNLDLKQYLYVSDGGIYQVAGSPQIGNGSTVAKEDLGSRNIEGVTAQGKRTTETIPAGQIGNVLAIKVVDEVWYSPELKMNVLTTHSDPRSGETVYKLTNINRAEQPKSLFEPPADYTVTGPAAGAGGRGSQK
jgi:hypothetical protein